MSRRRMKDIPPRTLTSWTQPARTTSLSMCSLSWEVRAVRLRLKMWLVGLLDRVVQLGNEQCACSFRASFFYQLLTSKPKAFPIMLPIVMIVLDGASGRVGATKSPLQEAPTPNLDALAARGSMGRMYTVGEGIAPESDAGVFSLIGYYPLETHLSRGVVEALGAGVEFHDGDLALRAGFATLKSDKLVDRRAGRNLSTPEAQELGAALNKKLRLKSGIRFVFKPTIGHRAGVVFRADGRRFSSNISNFDPAYVRKGNISLAQPGAKEYAIPRCEPLEGSDEAVVTAALVNEFGFKARTILDNHPVNQAR